jgi:hypothetical protein
MKRMEFCFVSQLQLSIKNRQEAGRSEGALDAVYLARWCRDSTLSGSHPAAATPQIIASYALSWPVQAAC